MGDEYNAISKWPPLESSTAAGSFPNEPGLVVGSPEHANASAARLFTKSPRAIALWLIPVVRLRRGMGTAELATWTMIVRTHRRVARQTGAVKLRVGASRTELIGSAPVWSNSTRVVLRLDADRSEHRFRVFFGCSSGCAYSGALSGLTAEPISVKFRRTVPKSGQPWVPPLRTQE